VKASTGSRGNGVDYGRSGTHDEVGGSVRFEGTFC
jgi:hypothetical protein